MTSESANIDSPRIMSMRVIPVAGYDSTLLNLSGAHAPFFTRNVVLMTDGLRANWRRRSSGRREDPRSSQ